MEAIFLKLVNLSITASWLVLVIMVLRMILRKVPKEMMVILWGIVGIRLICPFSLKSAFSVIPNTETIPMDIGNAPITIVEQGTTAITLPETSVQNLLLTFSIMWIVGMLLMGVYTIFSYWKIKRKVNEAINVQENIWMSDKIDTPFILGFVRPKIYLPYEMNEQDIKYVVAHEKAHLKRKDHLWKPLGFLILSIYWFNPILWIAYISLCKDIELACDEKVIREMGCEVKKPYSDALINCSVPRKMIAACPLAFGEVGVKKRIVSVLNYKKPAFWMLVIAVIVCLGLSIGFLTSPKGLDEQLQVFIDCEIASHHQSVAKTEEFSCLDWEVLGVDRKGNETTVYMWVFYEAYSYDNGVQVESGAHVPTVITVEKEDGSYVRKEYWEPGDGSEHAKDIREKFPWHLQRKALNPTRYSEKQQESCRKMAEEYFKEEYAHMSEVAVGLKKIYPQYFDLPIEKGLEVYIWQMAVDNYNCVLVPERKEAYTWKDFVHFKPTSIGEMRTILSTYDISKSDVAVKVIVMPYSSYTPASSFYGGDGEVAEAYQKQIENVFWGNADVYYTLEDEWGLTMGLTFLDATKFEVTFNHNTEWMEEEGELTTSSVYGINAIHNGESMPFGDYMRDVLHYDYADTEIVWDDVAYIIDKDGATTLNGDLTFTYGNLPPGIYELWKQVTLTKYDGKQFYRNYAVEFSVVD